MMPSLTNQALGAENKETQIFLRLMWIEHPTDADVRREDSSSGAALTAGNAYTTVDHCNGRHGRS